MMQHKGTQTLETGRLILRPFTASDARAVYENWASDDEVTRFLTWPTHRSVEVSQGFVDWCVQRYGQANCYCWGIEEKATHQLIGNISAVQCLEDIEALELGWVLGHAWWGRGIMPEAARAVIRFFFEQVGANRVWAGHDVNNPKSGRVMQKVGMRYEGRLRSAGRNNQGIVNIDQYAILRQDFLEA